MKIDFTLINQSNQLYSVSKNHTLVILSYMTSQQYQLHSCTSLCDHINPNLWFIPITPDWNLLIKFRNDLWFHIQIPIHCQYKSLSLFHTINVSISISSSLELKWMYNLFIFRAKYEYMNFIYLFYFFFTLAIGMTIKSKIIVYKWKICV